MQTAEEWLLGKLGEYKRNPRQTLKDMFVTTNCIIKDHLDNLTERTEEMLEICYKFNTLFFKELNFIGEEDY